MGKFALQISQFAEKAKENANRAVREVVLEVGSRVIYRTPVDTGRARGGWYYRLGGPSAVVPAGVNAPELQGEEVPTEAAGHLHTISNNLPYIRRLEYEGWSSQAPNGMVGITVAEFQGIVDQAAAKVRS